MPSVTLFPGTETVLTTSGTVGWFDASNIEAEDGANAESFRDMSAGELTFLLACTNYNAAAHIPAGATINGIQATLKKTATSAGSTAHAIVDNVVQLYFSGAIGSNKADAVTLWPGSLTNAVYGGSSDLWGWTPSTSNLRNSGFGLLIQVANGASGGNGTPGIDVASLTVWWTGGVIVPWHLLHRSV